MSFTVTDITHPVCGQSCAACGNTLSVGDRYESHPRYPTMRIVTHALCEYAADYRNRGWGAYDTAIQYWLTGLSTRGVQYHARRSLSEEVREEANAELARREERMHPA